MITIPNPSKQDTVTLYDMADAAEFLGIAEITLRLRLKQDPDLIRPIAIGRSYVFTRETLDAYAAARAKNQTRKETAS